MRSLIVVALSLSVLAVAGCSDADDADPTTTSGTVAPATTEALPPDTEATSTTVTTTATTTAPPTTEAPTTTLDPTAALIADIEADLNAGEQALMLAGADPANAALRADVARYFAGAGLERVNEFLDGLVRDGLVNRPNPDVPNMNTVEEVLSTTPESEAEVVFCRIDAAVIVEILPNGSEAIVNDQILATKAQVRMFPRDGIWVSEGDGQVITEQEGATTCADG
jgi:hypothetical protein